VLQYLRHSQVPTSTDVAAGNSFVAAVRAVPGDVFVVSHPWYAQMAGKAPHVQAAAYFDIVRSRDAGARNRVEGSVGDAVREQRFSAIVFARPTTNATSRRSCPVITARSTPLRFCKLWTASDR
jgi:hypothetical protein